jgi:thiamine-phosphate pyrophosphorylase
MAGMGGSQDHRIGSDGMRCRLYLITPPKLDPHGFADLLAAALDAGDVAAVQLRLKDVDDDAWRRAIDALRPVTQSRGVAFLLNDRADLVRATGCDGGHVGQEDMPAKQARALMGADATLGVTCKGSRDLAMQAGENTADYVAFGAFFPSGTKEVTRFIDPEILTWWSELMEVPCCAIGGITAENCAPLVQAGADFLAVVGAVWSHPEGPAAGVRALNAAIAAAQAG